MEGGRRDDRRMRERAPALQRRSRQRGDPAGVQGEAAVPVHAPAVPEDRVLSAQRSDARPRGLPPAEGFVRGRMTDPTVMPALVAGIHAFLQSKTWRGGG